MLDVVVCGCVVVRVDWCEERNEAANNHIPASVRQRHRNHNAETHRISSMRLHKIPLPMKDCLRQIIVGFVIDRSILSHGFLPTLNYRSILYMALTYRITYSYSLDR